MNAGVLEFYVKIKDLMSSGLAKVNSNARTAFNNVQRHIDETSRRNRNLSLSFEEVKRRIQEAERAITSSRMPAQIREARRELERLREVERNHVGNPDRERGMFMKGLGRAAMVGGLIAAGAGLSFGKSSIQAAMDFGATRKSFEVLTGNKQIGSDLTNQLNSLQANTILGPEVFKAAQTMMSFGITADKVMPTLKQIGDISMGDAQKLGSLTLAFSQMSATGRLTGQDLLQMINAGFNPLQEMSVKTGKSIADLKKEMEKGGISAAMVADAFKSATSSGGKFAGMMDQIATTSYGKMQILSGQWENFKIKAGEGLMPLAEDLMSLATKTLDWLDIGKTAPQILMAEQASVNSLVGSITSLNEGNSTRTKLLEMLKTKYPDLFSNLDTEKVKNNELLTILNDVNTAYKTRIGLASSNLLIDKNTAIAAESEAEYLRTKTISDALRSGNVEGAKSLMTWMERNVAFRFGADANTFSYSAGMAKMAADNANSVVKNATAQKAVSEQQQLVDMVRNMTDNKEAMAEIAAYDAAMRQQYRQGAGQLFGGAGKINYDYNRLKKFLPSGINAAGGASGGGSGSGVTDPAADIGKSVTSGGPRVININGVKFMDKMELHAATMREGMDEIERHLQDMFLRILNSGASVQ